MDGRSRGRVCNVFREIFSFATHGVVRADQASLAARPGEGLPGSNLKFRPLEPRFTRCPSVLDQTSYPLRVRAEPLEALYPFGPPLGPFGPPLGPFGPPLGPFGPPLGPFGPSLGPFGPPFLPFFPFFFQFTGPPKAAASWTNRSLAQYSSNTKMILPPFR